jgi:signal peptidase II
MPYARIVHWQNRGAAFGLFQDGNLVFTILAIIVSLAIIYYFPRVSPQDWLLRLALGLQFSGAVGNLIDRLHQGYVTDFVSLWTFPVFNVADASISGGVVVLLISAWLHERSESRRAAADTVEPDAEPADVTTAAAAADAAPSDPAAPPPTED